MAQINITLNGNIVRFERQGAFNVTKHSPFHKPANLPPEERVLSSVEDVKIALSDYGERMRKYALEGSRLDDATDDPAEPRNGLVVFASLAGKQRKPKGFGARRYMKAEINLFESANA